MSDPKDTLRALLDSYLRCPVEEARAELDQALRAYQTGWIRHHAGDATPAPAPAAAARPRPTAPKFPITAADREVLVRLADGWQGTTAEVTRWAWFENRELVTLEPNPTGEGPERLCLAPLGWAAVGRHPVG